MGESSGVCGERARGAGGEVGGRQTVPPKRGGGGSGAGETGAVLAVPPRRRGALTVLKKTGLEKGGGLLTLHTLHVSDNYALLANCGDHSTSCETSGLGLAQTLSASHHVIS